MDKLKTCPFCGSEAELHEIYVVKQYHVRCTNNLCGARMVVCEDKDEAIKMWNERKGEM